MQRKRAIPMDSFSICGKTVEVFPSVEPTAPVVYLHTFSGEGQKVYEAVQAGGGPPFTLAAVSGLDWNGDMTPWESPPAFPNAEPCTGGADSYLRVLTEAIVPAVEKGLSGQPCWRGLAGYSLAGLFALYAIFRTDLFSRVGSVSGSLWFPGVKEYVFSHEPIRRPECLYFSLGDKESKTRNPLLKSVRQNTEEIQSFFQTKGMDTVLEWNPGNHFQHAEERTAAGICWLLRR